MQGFIVEIPIAIYLRCVGKFTRQSPQYSLLKNGIVVYDENGAVVVRILCGAEKLDLLKHMFAIRPDFLAKIRCRPDGLSVEDRRMESSSRL
jgi:hypothetical protein